MNTVGGSVHTFVSMLEIPADDNACFGLQVLAIGLVLEKKMCRKLSGGYATRDESAILCNKRDEFIDDSLS